MKAKHLVWARRISQTFFLLLFLFLLIESRLPQDIFVDYSQVFSVEQDLTLQQPVTFFFELSPLVGLSSWVSGHQIINGFLWGIAVLVLTVLLGRVFCGFICPFGTLHHLVSWIKPSLKGDRMVKANQKTQSQKVKYFVLISLFVGAVMGLNMVGLLDPISFFFRSLALSVLPGVGVGLRALFDAMANSDIKVFNYLSYGEVMASPIFGYSDPAYQGAWFIGVLFLIILFLNRIRPRFWCRTLCPLGALLGLCARISLLRLEKDPDKCTNCHLCVKSCQGAASPIPGEKWETAECLVCFNCFHACPENALSFRFSWPPGLNPKPDVGRRAVLGGLVSRCFLSLFRKIGWTVKQSLRPSTDQTPRIPAGRRFPHPMSEMRALHEGLPHQCDQPHPHRGRYGRFLDASSHYDDGVLRVYLHPLRKCLPHGRHRKYFGQREDRASHQNRVCIRGQGKMSPVVRQCPLYRLRRTLPHFSKSNLSQGRTNDRTRWKDHDRSVTLCRSQEVHRLRHL